MRHGGDRGDARASVARGVLEAKVVGVEVQQLDRDLIGVRHRPTQQAVPGGLLAVGQGERRVPPQRDLALEQEALAGRALPLAAAVHEIEPLAEGGVENRLVLTAVDRLPDRLEMDQRAHAVAIVPFPSAFPLAPLRPLPFCWPPRFIRPLVLE